MAPLFFAMRNGFFYYCGSLQLPKKYNFILTSDSEKFYRAKDEFILDGIGISLKSRAQKGPRPMPKG